MGLLNMGGIAMAKLVFLAMILAVLLNTISAMDLTGDWKAATGEHLYIRQVNNTVWYYGESSAKNGNWTSVGYGIIAGNTLKLNWADVPKGNATLMGTAMLNITSDNELQVINQTGGWGENGYKLIRIRSGF